MSDMHSLLIAAILGVVEGLTEFLPVSSTGHMIIVGHLLGFEGDTAKTFEVVIQLGSILAVVVMFWRRLFGLIGIHFGRPLQHEGESKGRLTLIHILLGMIPAVVLGLLFHDTIKSLFNPINVMYPVSSSSSFSVPERVRPSNMLWSCSYRPRTSLPAASHSVNAPRWNFS